MLRACEPSTPKALDAQFADAAAASCRAARRRRDATFDQGCIGLDWLVRRTRRAHRRPAEVRDGR